MQAGVILEVLQNTLADADMMFPLDLGARGSCTIGGNIATNAGGINVLRYGMMRDLVLGLEAVLADGNLHLFICPGQAGDSREICDKVVYEPLRPLKGSVSAEHGIGTEKMAWLNVSRTHAEIVLMQRLKNLLDPTGVLNPNRVLC